MNQKIKDFLDKQREYMDSIFYENSVAREIANQNDEDFKEDLLNILEEGDMIVLFRGMTRIRAAVRGCIFEASNGLSGPVSPLKTAFFDFWVRCERFSIKPIDLDLKYWADYGEQVKQLLKTFLVENSLEQFEADPRFIELDKTFKELHLKYSLDGTIKPSYS